VSSPDEKDFFKVTNLREYSDNSGDELIFLSLYFRYDNRYFVYERVIYSFLDLIGNIGGLYEGLYFFGYFFVFLFSGRLYQASLMKRLYQERKKIRMRIKPHCSNNDNN